MLLSCPNCQTMYDVPDAALTGRSRTLRCDSCMATWKEPALAMVPAEPEPAAPGIVPPETIAASAPVLAPADAPAAAADVTPAVTPDIAGGAATPEPERISLGKTSRIVQVPVAPEPSATRGFSISMLLVLLIIAIILAAHRPIAHFWPPSLRLFNAIGLD